MSKYDAITELLESQSGRDLEIRFSELSALIPGGLPNAAYDWEVWWANDDATHTQSRSWDRAGYQASPDLGSKTVTFRSTAPPRANSSV